MYKNKFWLVVAFNIIIAFFYYIEGLSNDYTDLSSDLTNIVPICQKIDDVSRYNNDMLLDDINTVRYYTPFYIHSLRFIASFTGYDYLKALNVLGFISHFLFGVVWFCFFYLVKKNYWIAFLFSVFIRGVIWPPGCELLGISGIWSIMPRTLFLILLPIPFLIYSYKKNWSVYLAAFVLGLILNFHPISGVASIIFYVVAYSVNLYLVDKIRVYQLLKLFPFLIMGMIPFLFTYFNSVGNEVIIDQQQFEIAFRYRITELFFDPIKFIATWHIPIFYFFIFNLFVFYFFDSSENKKRFKIITIAVACLFVVLNMTVYIEDLINYMFDLNIRMSFQLIRGQKFVLTLMQLSMFLLACELSERFNIKQKYLFLVVIGYLGLLSFSETNLLQHIPIIRNDISKEILPRPLKATDVVMTPELADDAYIIDMFNYVNENTPNDNLFFCQIHSFRAATKRSVVFDVHASGMLIEGNPKAYVDHYQKWMKYSSYVSYDEKINYLKELGVDYLIVEVLIPSQNIVYKNERFYIYKI